MGRFASTAVFYAQSRPPYGQGFFDTVARRLGLRGTERLLDLGTGPGLLALGFAPWGIELVGVDPEPAMLAAARKAAERAGVRLRLIEGRAEDLPDNVGLFDIVTIGRALHWMDPEPTRAVLDRVVAPGGSVLICRSSPVSDGRNPWLEPYDVARGRWNEAGSPRRHVRDHSAFFDGTRLRFRETIAVECEQDIALTALVDRVLSMSTSSPDRIGADIGALRDAIGAALGPFAKGGVLHEVIEARADLFTAEKLNSTGKPKSARTCLARPEPTRKREPPRLVRGLSGQYDDQAFQDRSPDVAGRFGRWDALSGGASGR